MGAQATAARLIADKGQAVTLTRHSAGAYNTADSSVTLSDTQTATSGVVLPLSRGFYHSGNIKTGDQQLLLPGTITAPQIDDNVTVGGVAYTITEVAPLAPDGTALVFDCIIRGAS